MRSLKFCLIGAGEMAEIHALNLCALPGVEVVAVVDPNAERAAHVAAACGAKVVSVDEAFGLSGIDGYVIASPPRTHADYLERAADTGAYVFCEKPIDHDLGRARAVLARLKGREDRVQLGFNRRFDANFIALKQAITDGAIGRVEQLLIISRDPENPPLEGFQNSSGMLKETSIHDFDLVRWLLEEEPAEIFVMGGAVINPDYATIGQIDTATTTIRMKSGRQVTVMNSLRAAFGYDQRIEVLGSEGQVAVGNLAESLVILSNAAGVTGAKPHWNYPQRYAAAYAEEMRAFARAVATGQPVTPDARDGLRASEMSEAAILSWNEGRPVTLETQV